MRPKTRESGIFNTKRSSDVSVSRLTRMLVPKPNKAFQSPGTQSRIFAFILPPLAFLLKSTGKLKRHVHQAVPVKLVYRSFCFNTIALHEGGQNLLRVRHPAENAA